MATTAVVAGTATAVSGAVAGHQQKKAMAAQQEAAEQQQVAELQTQQEAEPAPAPAPAAPGATDLASQLQQLAALKQQGILSEAEFDAAKQKLLAG